MFIYISSVSELHILHIDCLINDIDSEIRTDVHSFFIYLLNILNRLNNIKDRALSVMKYRCAYKNMNVNMCFTVAECIQFTNMVVSVLYIALLFNIATNTRDNLRNVGNSTKVPTRA